MYKKSIDEFYKECKGRVQLAQLDINTLTPEDLLKHCRTCHERAKGHSKKGIENKRKRADEEKLRHIKTSTWESQDIQGIFEQT